MHFTLSSFGFITLVSSSVFALHLPRADLAARNDVDECEAILIALQASSFCSSFVPITDVTLTATATGAPSTTTVTATASTCTSGTTAAVSAKVKRTVTTNTGTATATTNKSQETTTTASTSKCSSIKGLPPAVEIFACEVIDEACLAFVKPKTTSKTITVPGTTSTATTYVTTQCPTPTASCPSTNGPLTASNGKVFNVQCNTNYPGNELVGQFTNASLQSCINACATFTSSSGQTCIAIDYYGLTGSSGVAAGSCFLLGPGTYASSPANGIDAATLVT